MVTSNFRGLIYIPTQISHLHFVQQATLAIKPRSNPIAAVGYGVRKCCIECMRWIDNMARWSKGLREKRRWRGHENSKCRYELTFEWVKTGRKRSRKLNRVFQVAITDEASALYMGPSIQGSSSFDRIFMITGAEFFFQVT